MSLFNELKRRNVFRVAIAYLVIAWLLAQVSATLENALNMPAWFDTMVVSLLLIGFPIAMFFAWVFELTPEGIKREKDIRRDDSIVDQSSKKLNYVTIVAALAVLGMFVWQQFGAKDIDSGLRGNDVVGSWNDDSVATNSDIPNTQTVISAQVGNSTSFPEIQEIQSNTIAVLPFADLSQAGDQEYFSDGMSEEILNVLVRVDALQVTSRTSAFQFKGSKKGIPAIAKELKVRHVLEGSVRKSGETLRITAQLIDAQNDKHLWSETYDRPLNTENIFAIQDEISNAIVTALKVELKLKEIETVHVKQGTENLSAYELFLKARPLFVTRQQLDKADEMLAQALELDAEFAQAWSMRAAIANLNVYYGFSYISEEQSVAKSFEYVNRALKIDPENVLALAVSAFTREKANHAMRGQFDFADILIDYQKALKLEPKNTTVLLWIGGFYEKLGFVDKSINFYKQCMEHEPSYKPCVANYLSSLEYTGHYKEAIDLYIENVSNGLLNSQDAPLEALVQMKQKLPFLMAINSEYYFKGWHKNHEIYQAYQMPQSDHAELIKEAVKWVSSKEKEPLYWRYVLMPIGYEPDPKLFHEFYEVFLFKPKNINSPVIKKYLKDTGVFNYWQQDGFPPLCHPLGEDDFECG